MIPVKQKRPKNLETFGKGSEICCVVANVNQIKIALFGSDRQQASKDPFYIRGKKQEGGYTIYVTLRRLSKTCS